MHPRTPLADRFWSKIRKDGPIPTRFPELGPCWLWTAANTSNGYGRIRVGGRGGPQMRAHRLAWELTNGPIGDSSIFVMHKCDNPPCCNPAHLSLGTHAENMADCSVKGRTKEQRGSNHALTKLTEYDVIEMRAAWLRGEKLIDIAAKFGIRKSTASYIVNGKTWTHVPMPTLTSSTGVL